MAWPTIAAPHAILLAVVNAAKGGVRMTVMTQGYTVALNAVLGSPMLRSPQ